MRVTITIIAAQTVEIKIEPPHVVAVVLGNHLAIANVEVYNSAKPRRQTAFRQRKVPLKVVNSFWVAGDILVIVPQGNTQEVFRLASNDMDATNFGRRTAEWVAKLMESRIQQLQAAYGRDANTKFDVVPSPTKPGLWVVRGTQEVDVDPEG